MHGNHASGIRVPGKMDKGLEEYMKKMGFRTAREMRDLLIS